MNSILQTFNVPKQFPRLAWAGLVAALLTACGTVTPALDDAAERFDFVTTLTIDADTSRAELEAAFGGSVIVFHPEAGFAILGMTEAAVASTSGVTSTRDDILAAVGTDTDSNASTFAAPEVVAEGFSSWSGGFSSWSGGFSSWSGGFSSWSGGFSSWSGGSPEPTTFAENLSLWDQINLPEAQVLAPNLGAGVKVAVIDTGIDLDHPAFEGKLAPASEWMDFIDGDDEPMDEKGGAAYGHGTGVAGVIVQVAPNVTILPIRVLDTHGHGDSTDVVAAVDWAVANGADIINLSLGSHVDVTAFRRMLVYAAQQGVAVIASSGNTGLEQLTYPAAYTDSHGMAGRLAIGVGSVDAHDVKSIFSTYGSEMALMAPGEFVTTLVPDSQVGYWSGTSFSTPMVSGVLALAVAEPGRADMETLLKELLAASDSIMRTNDRIYHRLLGDGRLDAEVFLQRALR